MSGCPFTYTTRAQGGYEVRDEYGTYLGDVERGRSGWSSRVPEDAAPTPADRKTRQDAAERLVLIRSMRRGNEDVVTTVPAGYELVDATLIQTTDVVLTPAFIHPNGSVIAWYARGPRTVYAARATESLHTGTMVQLTFDLDRTGGGRHRDPYLGSGPWRQVARRIETTETRAATAAEAARYRFSRTLTDFDFMVLVDFEARVRSEHSATYAFANWPFIFEDPGLNDRAADLEGLLALCAQYRGELDAWATRLSAEDQIDHMSRHTQLVHERYNRARETAPVAESATADQEEH